MVGYQLRSLLNYFHLSIKFYGSLKLASKSVNDFWQFFLFSNISQGCPSNPRTFIVFIILVASKEKQNLIQ
jgi:hypothetical protein